MVSQGGETALFKAVQFKQTAIIEYLLTKTNSNNRHVDKVMREKMGQCLEVY